eukprot:PITA_05949
MLRMYVMHQKWKWEEYLPLVKFAYENGYQESLRMSPFEAFYGWSCSTPISWSYLVNKVLIGSEMLADMEHEMQAIKKNLKVTKDRHKSYADQNRSWANVTSGMLNGVADVPKGEAVGRVVLHDLDIAETLVVLQDQITGLTVSIQDVRTDELPLRL